jgi:hypothetical protein
MEKEIWEILKALDDKKLTAIEAHKKLCGLYINGVVFNQTDCTEQSEVELCDCGVNERVGLDCTMKPCKHPKYNEVLKTAIAKAKPNMDKINDVDEWLDSIR